MFRKSPADEKLYICCKNVVQKILAGRQLLPLSQSYLGYTVIQQTVIQIFFINESQIRQDIRSVCKYISVSQFIETDMHVLYFITE